MLRFFFVFLIGISGVVCVNAQQQFEIRYLGNMGIALTHNDSTILVDGLHDFYEKDYLPTDATALSTMLQQKTPYKRIIAIAVTHRHSDHVDSTLITNVANVHTAAILLGGDQTRSLLSPGLLKRFPPIADSITIRLNTRLEINLRRIAHTYQARHSAIENYRIEVVWNGFRIVHLGDADLRPAALTSLKNNPDIIVIPNWFLSNEGIKLLNELKPARVLVTHISPGDNENYQNEKLRAAITAFQKYGDLVIMKL